MRISPLPPVPSDTTPPTITGLSNDATPAASKTWSWGCSESGCTYLYTIDTNPTTTPSGAYGSTTTATQSTGTGTHYLHIIAKDAAGNASAVGHYSAILARSPTLIHVDISGANKSWTGDGLPFATGSKVNAVADANSNLASESNVPTGVGVSISGYEAPAIDATGDAQAVMSDFVTSGNTSIVATITGLPAGTHSFYVYPCPDPNMLDPIWGLPLGSAPVVLKRAGVQQGASVTPTCAGWVNGDSWTHGDNVVKFTTTVTAGQEVKLEVGFNLAPNQEASAAWALGGIQIELDSQ